MNVQKIVQLTPDKFCIQINKNITLGGYTNEI